MDSSVCLSFCLSVFLSASLSVCLFKKDNTYFETWFLSVLIVRLWLHNGILKRATFLTQDLRSTKTNVTFKHMCFNCLFLFLRSWAQDFSILDRNIERTSHAMCIAGGKRLESAMCVKQLGAVCLNMNFQIPSRGGSFLLRSLSSNRFLYASR